MLQESNISFQVISRRTPQSSFFGGCKVWVEQISDPGSSLTPNNVLLLISPKSEIQAFLTWFLKLFIHENVK